MPSAKESQKAVKTMSRMVTWSKMRRPVRCRSTQAPNLALSATPAPTGSTTCHSSCNARPQRWAPSALVCRKMLHSKGVSTMPNKLEILALKMAAGRLPPAMLTITTDVDTVLGSAHRKKILCQSSSPPSAPKKGCTSSANAGNSPNVASCTNVCSCQLRMPARSFSKLSFRP